MVPDMVNKSQGFFAFLCRQLTNFCELLGLWMLGYLENRAFDSVYSVPSTVANGVSSPIIPYHSHKYHVQQTCSLDHLFVKASKLRGHDFGAGVVKAVRAKKKTCKFGVGRLSSINL